MENLKNKYDEGLITDRDIGNEVFFLPLFRLKLNAIEQRYFRSGRLTLFLGRLVQAAPYFQTMLL